MREVVRRLSLSLLSLLAVLTLCGTLRASTDFVVPPGADPTPIGITKGPDGNVWFVEATRNAIAKITPAGAVTEYPVPGARALAYITLGPDNNLWFTDIGASSVGRITPAGVITTYPASVTFTYGSQSYSYPSYPYDITAGPDGGVWFTSYSYGYYNLFRIEPSSGVITQVSINPSGACADRRIVTGSDKNLWFIDDCASLPSLVKISTTGQVLAEVHLASTSGYVYDVVSGPDGNLWATAYTSQGMIVRVATAGTVASFPLASGNYAYDIASSPTNGNLWFKESVNADGIIGIGIIALSGVLTEGVKTLESSQLQLTGYNTFISYINTGITEGADGNLWSADGSSDDIHKIVVASKTIVEEKLTLSAQPTAITTGADGNLWFIESRSQMIGRSTTSGGIASFPMPTANSQPQQITKGPGGAGGVAWFTELGPYNSNNPQPGMQRVARINADGSINEFAVPADAACVNYSNYYGPAGIALGSDGNMWVADTCGSIEKFDPIAGQQIQTYATTQGCVNAITAGPKNDLNLWYLDSCNQAVNKISTSGSFGTSIPTTPLSFSSYNSVITPAADGNLWFGSLSGYLSANNYFYGLGQVTPSGQYTHFNLYNTPFSFKGTLTSGADGALWGTNGSSAYSISTQGTYEDCSGPGGTGYFTYCPAFSSNLPGITTGPDGKLWVTQQSSSTISRFSAISGSLQITPDCTQPNSCLSNTLVSFQANFADGTPGAQATDLTATVTVQAVTANYTYSQFAAPVVNIGPGQFAVVLQPQTLILSGTYYFYLTLHDSVDNQDYYSQSTFTIGYNTTTTVTATPNPAGVGFPVTLTAHVVGAKPGPPLTGTVTFYAGSFTGTADVDQNGYATLTTSSIPQGSNFVSAQYLGDNNYMPSYSSNSLYESVLPVQGDLFGNNAQLQAYCGPNCHTFALNAYALATADFDGDGIPDVAVADNIPGAPNAGGYWTLEHGMGDGRLSYYTYFPPYPSGVVESIAVGDFNGDGKPDVVVAKHIDDANDTGQADGVDVFLNQGNNSFSNYLCTTSCGYLTFAAGTRPIGVAVGDFNRDGKLDVAVVNRGSASVSILLGNGDGTFQAPLQFGVAGSGAGTPRIVVGDFNRDGAPDIAVTDTATPGFVSVLINKNDGTGNMLPATNYTVGNQPIGLAAADVNGDGKLDLISANSGSDDVSVLIGNGDGTFQTAVAYSTGPAGSAPWAVTVGDVNRDGKPDLLVANSGGNTLAVLAGNGDGTFRGAQPYAVDQTPRDVLALDANRDGATDVVTANEAGYPVTANVTNAQVVSNVATLTSSAYAGYSLGDTVTVSGMTPDAFYNGTYTITAVSGYTFSYALAHADAAAATETGTAIFPSGGDISVLMGASPGPQNPNYTLTNLPAGQTPSRVAVGDFDRNGNADIAVVDTNFNSVSNCPPPSGSSPCDAVSVILNNGTAGGMTTFAPHVDYLLPDTFTREVAVGDFNRDGILDLVTVSGLHNSGGTPGVNVLLGNSNGTFQAPVTYSAGADPKAVAVGDFNGDGILDLAVVDKSTGTVNILLGCANAVAPCAGPGTFAPAVAAPALTGGSPTAIVTGDFNGDGKLDLAVLDTAAGPIDGAGINTLLGNGDGTFQAPHDFNIPAATIPNSGSALAVGDFNRDGKLDLAVSNQNNQVSILLGDGAGNFPTAVNYVTSATSSVWGISVVDYNHDGIPDLAIASNTDNAVTLLAGNGDGTFQPPTQVGTGASTLPSGIAFADLNGDGVPDLITGNQGNNSVSVLMSGTKGTSQKNIAGACTGGTTVASVLADFNGDGFNDLAVLNGTCNSVTIQLNDPNNPGSLQAALSPSNPVGNGPSAMAAGDFNGDGIPDLVVANKTDGTVSVLIANKGTGGKGDGTFQPQVTYSTGGTLPSSIFVTDVNNDGNLDIAVVNSGSGNVSVLLGKGDGTFGAAQIFSVSPHLPPALSASLSVGAAGMAMGDLNGDGVPDMAVAEPTANQVSVLINSGLGGFAAPVSYAVGMNPQAVAIGHFNGSGPLDCTKTKAYCDIAVANQGSNTVSILLNDGSGNFKAARSFATGKGPSAIAALDYNNDGKLDLVVTNGIDNTVMVLPGNGDGTFQSGIVIGAATGPNSVSVGNLTSGGSNDIVVTNGSGNNIGVLLNQAAVKMGCLPPGTLTAGICVMPNATFGNPIALTATIAAAATSTRLPGGTVTFTNQTTGTVLGTAPVDSSGHAVLNTNRIPANNPPGTSYTITGGYSGDSFFNNGNVTFSQTVNQASTSVQVTSSQNPSSIGQAVTFTANVSSAVSIAVPTGSVQFVLDGTTNMGTAKLDPFGNAAISYGGGTCPQQCLSLNNGLPHTIVATYQADSNFTGNTSPPFNQLSNPASSSVVLSSPGQTSVYNQPIAFTVSVKGTNSSLFPTGTVNVSYDNGNCATSSNCLGSFPLSNGVAAFNSKLPIGTHVISATYAPDSTASFSSGTSMPIAQVVKQAPTRSVISSTPNPGASPTLNVNVSGSYGGTATGNVTFTDTLIGGAVTQLGSPALSGNSTTLTPTLVGGGIHHIVAAYGGDNNYLGSSDGVWQVVSSGGAATTLTATLTAPKCPSCVGRGGQLKLFNKAGSFLLLLQVTSPTAGTDAGIVLVIDDDTVLASSDGSEGVKLATSTSCAPPSAGQSTVACYAFPLPPLTIGQHQLMAVAANDGTFDGAVANNGQPAGVNVTPQPH